MRYKISLLALTGALCAAATHAQAPGSSLEELVTAALRSNPELIAARHEREAARQRIAPAGALEDPMVEAGILNLPTTSYRLNREDMTMKMLGIAQKLPWPGKRSLREQVASRGAETADQGVRETENRVVRDVRLAYYELALVSETLRLTQESRRVLEQLLAIGESRYRAGQGTQADVLRLQTQLARMSDELLRLERERPVAEAELDRLTGETATLRQIAARLLPPREARLEYASLREAALQRRPQLTGLRAAVERAGAAVELARSEYKPDFELRASYGQRENMLDGTRRSDLLSFTVAINVPLWTGSKTDPRVAEAQAMRDQALALYEAQEQEVSARLRQQIAIAEQSSKSAQLYASTILPQAELAFDSALSSYRVSRADLAMLLDSQMSLFSYRINRAGAITGFNKALAEIDLLTGAAGN